MEHDHDATAATSRRAGLTRRAAMLGPLFAMAACGGGGDAPPPPPPPPSGPPVDGPAWFGFARSAQHGALSDIASQSLTQVHWSTPVDLAPPYNSNGSLLAHYGSPVITRRNTVVLPLRTSAGNTFAVEARDGSNGVLKWTLPTAWVPPAAGWLPSLNPVLTSDGRIVVPTSGGRLLVRDDPDSATGAQRTLTFYGSATYDAAPATYDAAVRVATPLTADAQGNVYFGFVVTAANPANLVGGFARVAPDGSGTWVPAATAAADPAMTKPAINAAPALSNDGSVLYAVVSNVPAAGARAIGRLVALDAATLAPRASIALIDPLLGAPAWVSDNGTSSPTVGPDGDVYIGVLEASPPSHNFRGWLLHFDAALAVTRTPGGFGWDATPGIVPRAMVPSYAGTSDYLLMIKHNSYGGVGTGDGQHRVAILDPNATQGDRYAPSAAVMLELMTALGPTPDPTYPGGVREWCINTAAVDPATGSVLMNSEDGYLYRWHLPTNTLSERIALNNGYAQAYTPTAIGPDGRVYAVNNARLFSVGA